MANAKKLSYDMEEPAFLRRMRQAAGGAGRQERYIAPRNRKVHVDNDEDAPAYVLEGGHDTISKEEFEAMAGKKGGDEDGMGGRNEVDATKTDPTKEDEAATNTSNEGTKQAIAEVGHKKKRKAAKIVGVEDDGDEVVKKDKLSHDGKRKAGGKAKRRVKLSFDDSD